MKDDRISRSFQQFYAAIEKSYQALNSDRIQIEDRKQKMLELLQTCIQVPKPPEGNGEYQAICRENIQKTESQLKSWQALIQQQIERSEFVNRHEKSILALVFADVNAGKSSLGNFVGGWNLKDTAYHELYIPHDCEIEDYSRASTESRQVRVIDHFAENATEATSTIQHYTLAQGLTWVDTPGLHSLTVEHGELAQEYIQFADLVVYLTPSSSPFKKDEREMLEKLFQMGKPVILAIAKSDMTKQVIEDGKIVNVRLPKSVENRKKQEAFVTEQVQEIRGNSNMENSHVLSLSVRLARDAVQTENEQMYADSNLGQFLEQMGSILSEKAIELKMRRPKAEINSFIDSLTGMHENQQDLSTISQLQEGLAEKHKELSAFLEGCKNEEREICAEVERQMSVKLSLVFRSLRDRNLLDNAETVRNEMSQAVSGLVIKTCKKRLERMGSLALSLKLPELHTKNASGTGYQIQYEKHLIQRQEERDPKGFIENVQHFFNKDKKFYDIVTHTEHIKSGDNFKGFLDSQMESIRPEVREFVGTSIGRMIEVCICPLLDCYENLGEQLKHLTTQLEQLRFAEN